MPEMQFFTERDGAAPRTIAHALELLRAETDFTDADIARISIGPRLPASQPAWGFGLIFHSAIDNKIFSVLLSACATVHAIREGHSDRESIGIEELDGATVNANGSVLLANGSQIRAVEVQRVILPCKLSHQDRRILILVVKMISGRRPIYRFLRRGIPREYQKMVPRWKTIDFSSVAKTLIRAQLQLPLLKQIQREYEKRFPHLQAPSHAKISDTLRKVGMREQ
jgi:hypothetical protein